MTARLAHELLYDSEAALRLVDSALEGLDGDPLPGAARELTTVLVGLRQCRGMLERATTRRLAHTTLRMATAPSPGEAAAANLSDAVDRCLVLLDEMGHCDADNGDRATVLRDCLRDELLGTVGHLQLQEVMLQQLAHVSTVLAELERRLTDLARTVEPSIRTAG
jgi:hypothetical protein